MPELKYNKSLLEEVCIRDKCTIDFSKIEKYNRDVKIEFTCNCGNNYIKTIGAIYNKAGAYCKECTKNRRKEKFKNIVRTPEQQQLTIEKTKQTNLKRYGVEYSTQLQTQKDKLKQTCLEKYGVEHPSQVKEFKDKVIATCLKNHGVEHHNNLQSVKDKVIATNLMKYGVEHHQDSKQFKDKYKNTCLQNHGVENPSQNAIISEKQCKNGYKLKEFKFPCGNIVKVQGYEPFLLKKLVELGYGYNDIITNRTDVPEIWYLNNKNKKCRYYCDIFIYPNTIYEVKSLWTYKLGKDNILLKEQACIKAGYVFKLFIYNDKGIEQEINDTTIV